VVGLLPSPDRAEALLQTLSTLNHTPPNSLMNLKEILKFADRAVFNKTGKHLNDLQQDILEATLQGHQYNIL
ncbi:MAG TPA: hypothetical protein V6C58_08420, partial [Allocoleopsis sp.]